MGLFRKKYKRQTPKTKEEIVGEIMIWLMWVAFIAFLIFTPTLKIIWMLLMFPLEVMTGTDITGDPIIHTHPEPTVLKVILGFIGVYCVAMMIIKIIIDIFRK